MQFKNSIVHQNLCIFCPTQTYYWVKYYKVDFRTMRVTCEGRSKRRGFQISLVPICIKVATKNLLTYPRSLTFQHSKGPNVCQSLQKIHNNTTGKHKRQWLFSIIMWKFGSQTFRIWCINSVHQICRGQ